MSKPSQLEDHVGFWLRFVSNHVSSRFAQLVEARGVTVSEWVALRELLVDEPPSASTLMQRLGMTKGAVSKVLARLEEKGLVRRTWDRDDGRAQVLELSAAGRKLVPVLARLADENDAHFFDALPKAERKQLIATLRRLVDAHHLKEVPTE
ncbi:MAG: MarR family winged helix-turn-helix transcriptional regulator [Archangium sp.]